MKVMVKKRLALLIGLSAFGQIASAQEAVSIARPEPIIWMPRVVFRPLVSDSTLLLLSRDLVWRCEQDDSWGGGTYFEVDFEHIVSCEGRREVYELVNDYGESYDYRILSRTLKARLIRTSDSTFLYTEMAEGDTTTVVRTIPLIMDFSNPVYVDSSYTEDIQTGSMRLMVSKMVELKTIR